ncbi:phage tail protein [Herbaspirillum huttiense]|uniref:phage tail protein n=1 Tax=Herbaspirillum huttiense TaxID=863372 RepID=UPI001065A095|nr:phage tail protein [Herbaspirillum huttiense]QBP75405.1 phage tail protein [Herbaspirillum huttiense]
MAYNLPDGSKLSIAATLAAAVNTTALSNAAEAVAAVAAGAALAAGDIVVVNAPGWLKLDRRVARIKNFNAGAVTLEGIDTSNTDKFPAGSGVGSLQKVLTWQQIPQVTAFESSGGDQNFATVEFLDDDQQRQVPTTKSPQTLSITAADDPTSPHGDVLSAADEARAIRPLQLALPSGPKIFYNGYVSYNATPTLTKGNIMTTKASLALVSRPTRYQT